MIPILDLKGQYLRIKDEIDSAVANVIDSCKFINGPQVKEFAEQLAEYTGAKYVIPVANGTDALQVSLMSLRLNPGDEIIVPSFTYIASAEVIALLNLVPVMVDVDYNSFNTTAENIQRAISRNTKAIIPVHLFGQSCPMEGILNIDKMDREEIISELRDKYADDDDEQNCSASDLLCCKQRHEIHMRLLYYVECFKPVTASFSQENACRPRTSPRQSACPWGEVPPPRPEAHAWRRRRRPQLFRSPPCRLECSGKRFRSGR